MPEIFSVGHGARPLEEFLAILREVKIAVLADVRSFPGSRRYPQFGAKALAGALADEGIAYVHLVGLGGRREPRDDSPHRALRVAAFRGYADHMRTGEFADALERLEALARSRPTAIMCAEALWFRCHRRLVSDALLVRGWRVLHIGSDGRATEHELTPFAVVSDGRLTYPAEQTSLGI